MVFTNLKPSIPLDLLVSLSPMRYFFIVVLIGLVLGCDSNNQKKAESLIYSSERNGNTDLYAIDVLGQWERRITTNDEDAGFPKWNPAMQQLIYYSTGEDQKSFAVSMTIGKTPVDTLPNGDLQNYQLTPDGKRILYTEVRDGFQHIWWCNSDGYDQVQLTETNSTNGDFSISPSGDKLLFVSDRSGQKELYLLNLLSIELDRLTDNNRVEQYSTWSPDGSKIAYTMRATEEGSHEDIYILDLNNGELTQLTKTPYAELEIAWSLNGDKIAFHGATTDGDHIYTIDIADGKFTKITSGDAYHSEPTWVPGEY